MFRIERHQLGPRIFVFGIRAHDWHLGALILLGLSFMVAEVFFPAFGSLGAGGIIAFAIGAIMLIDTDVPGFGVPIALIVGLAAISGLFMLLVAAVALKARRLVFMSDVPGLLRDPKNDASLLRHLAVGEVPQLRKIGVIGEGMIPKVDSAVAAIETGVEKVQFVDGRIPHSVLLEIFTDAGVGTEVVL